MINFANVLWKNFAGEMSVNRIVQVNDVLTAICWWADATPPLCMKRKQASPTRASGNSVDTKIINSCQLPKPTLFTLHWKLPSLLHFTVHSRGIKQCLMDYGKKDVGLRSLTYPPTRDEIMVSDDVTAPMWSLNIVNTGKKALRE